MKSGLMGSGWGNQTQNPELYYGKGVNLFLVSPQANSGLGSRTRNLGIGFSAGRYEDGWGLGPNNPERNPSASGNSNLLINTVLEEFSKCQSVHNVRHTCKIAS